MTPSLTEANHVDRTQMFAPSSSTPVRDVPWTDKENADPVDVICRHKAAFRATTTMRARWLSISPNALRTAMACHKTIERAKEAGLVANINGEIPDEQIPCAARILGALCDMRVAVLPDFPPHNTAITAYDPRP